MGDFYETFERDAEVVADVLGITLTKRGNGAAEDIPLAGFPHHALETHLPKLVSAGYRVAVCEQLEDANDGMMEWMGNMKPLDELREKMDDEAIITFIEKEAANIAKVEMKMNAAIGAAAELFGGHSHDGHDHGSGGHKH